MELLDIYDDRNNALNKIVSREEVHKNGFWHRKFVCIITDENDNSVLFQSQYKKKNSTFSRPEFLNISVGGHLVSGENISDGIREFHEESGLESVKFEDLKFLGIRQSSFSICNDEKNYINNEFQYIFIYKNKFDADSFKINGDEETKGFVKINISDGIDLLTNKINTIKAEEYINSDTNIVDITINNFIPDYLVKDKFMLRNFVVAKRYLENPDNELLFW